MRSDTRRVQSLAAFLIVEIAEMHGEEVYAKYREAVSPISQPLAELTLFAAAGGGTRRRLASEAHRGRAFRFGRSGRMVVAGVSLCRSESDAARSITTNMILAEGVPDAY